MATDAELDASVRRVLLGILDDGGDYSAIPLLNPDTSLFAPGVVDALRGPLESAVTELDADVAQLQPAVASLETLVEEGRLSEPNLTSTFAPVVGRPAAAGAGVSAGNQIRILSLGDSIAHVKWRFTYAILNRALGYTAGGQYPGNAIETSQSGTGWSLPGFTLTAGGSSTQVLDAFDAWFSGRVYALTGGGYREFGGGGAAASWTVAKVYYAKGPTSADAGTFKISVDGVDETGFTSVSTVAGTQDIGVATITKGSYAQRALRVTNLTGNTRIIGVGFFTATASGAVFAGIAQGGITLDDALSVGALQSLRTFLDDYQPQIVTLEMKEHSSTWATNLATLLPLIREEAPSALVIGIGSTPTAVNDADQVTQNAQLKAACAAFGATYWDGYSPVTNYATLNAIGWAGDGIHVSDACNAFLGGLMVNDLGLLAHPSLYNGRNVNAATVLAQNVGIGTTAPTQPLDVASSGASVATVRTTSTTGQYADLRLISGFSGVFGDARVRADGAKLRIMGPTVGGTAIRTTLEANNLEGLSVDSERRVRIGGTEAQILAGAGTPEGFRTAPVGAIYLRTDGGAATTLYVKEANTTAYGWVAK